MWTDDDLEPVQMMDTKTKVTGMMLVILVQMGRRFVYSRRMKKFAWSSKHNTRLLFRKEQPMIRNSVCIASL